MTIARYPFTCCTWSALSAEDRELLIQLVNAAGDRMSTARTYENYLEGGDTIGPPAERGASQRGRVAQIRARALARKRP